MNWSYMEFEGDGYQMHAIKTSPRRRLDGSRWAQAKISATGFQSSCRRRENSRA